jgi:hypothetical protein
MSRSGVFGGLVAVVTLAAAASLVACAGRNKALLFVPDAPFVDSVRINFSCSAAVDAIALTDMRGHPAWIFRRKQKDPITWLVPANVTINSIVGTAQDPLPADPDPAGPGGHAPGGSLKMKVKDVNDRDEPYHYAIDATCTAPGIVRHLVIDPEMIIRRRP